MWRSHLHRRRPVLAALAAWVGTAAVLAAPARAQSAGSDFLLGTPRGSLSIRAGYDRALAGSDLFTFTTDRLTLGKGDFSGPSLAADLGFRLSDRLDLVIGSAISGANARSAFRRYRDASERPIEQTTRFLRVPVSASVKAYLAPRGRSIGRLAWVPTRLAPYVGAGGGFIWYRFEQRGDFVDEDTASLPVFSTTYSSSSWSPEAHAMIGADYSLNPRLALTGEARYLWARGSLGQDYSNFGRIDLSGIAATAGLTIRF